MQLCTDINRFIGFAIENAVNGDFVTIHTKGYISPSKLSLGSSVNYGDKIIIDNNSAAVIDNTATEYVAICNGFDKLIKILR